MGTLPTHVTGALAAASLAGFGCLGARVAAGDVGRQHGLLDGGELLVAPLAEGGGERCGNGLSAGHGGDLP